MNPNAKLSNLDDIDKNFEFRAILPLCSQKKNN